MLEYFITSASRRKILTYLLNHSDEENHIRELSRKLGQPAPVVKRELDTLDEMGLILSWFHGNQRRFRVNRNSLFWPELKSLIDKSRALSAPPKVSATYAWKDIVRRRGTWRKRSREIAESYGKYSRRKRPRHPSEIKLLEDLS